MGGSSERELSEQLLRIKEKANKVADKVKDNFAKIEEMNADSLKKLEEMKRSAEKALEKLEHEADKSSILAPESRQRVNTELANAKNHVRQTYEELKERILASIMKHQPRSEGVV